MKAKDIQQLSAADLKVRIQELGGEYSTMRLNHAVSSLDNPGKIRETRRDLARFKTVLRVVELKEKKRISHE